MTRKDFQELAEIRLNDARALLRVKRYDGAYYLAGYAVECALKACPAKRIKQYDFPDRDFVKKAYTHDLAELLRLANIEKEFEREQRKDPDLSINWNVTKGWTEQSRYERHGKQIAEKMVNAVGDSRHGVLQCLREFW
ncbi:MAG: HEPN domain-containing protein [Acidobacteria bacterium]|nr:HEPN domain-containing protein [Acidobacteriota bacterium]